MLIWKFNASLPWVSTLGLSDFFISQTMSGPRIFPKGNTKPAKPRAWHNTSHVRLTGAAVGCIGGTPAGLLAG